MYVYVYVYTSMLLCCVYIHVKRVPGNTRDHMITDGIYESARLILASPEKVRKWSFRLTNVLYNIGKRLCSENMPVRESLQIHIHIPSVHVCNGCVCVCIYIFVGW